ncbi:hypothetical protein ACTFIZ_005508 [Dictyostelium cf. discoideum]
MVVNVLPIQVILMFNNNREMITVQPHYLLYFLNTNNIRFSNYLLGEDNNKNIKLVNMNQIMEDQLNFNKRQFQKYKEFMDELLEIEQQKARTMDLLAKSLKNNMENTNKELNNIQNQINQIKQ